MPEITREYRTIMYSIRENGDVVVHKLPFNANDSLGMEKLKRLQARGFTFDDPRKNGHTGIPQVIITKTVDLNKPATMEDVETVETESERASTLVTTPQEIKVSEAEISEEEELPLVSFIMCPECGEGPYKSFWALQSHIRKHKRERGELKPYKHKKGKVKRRNRVKVSRNRPG